MGLNIEKFEPSPNSTFQDFLDWVNGIANSPILREYRDTEGNLIWDEDNPSWKSDTVTDKFTSSTNNISRSVEIDIDEALLSTELSSSIKISCQEDIIYEFYHGGGAVSNEKCVHKVELYDSNTGSIIYNSGDITLFTQNTNSGETTTLNKVGVISFSIDSFMIEKIRNNEISPKIRFTISHTFNGSNSNASFDIDFTIKIIEPKRYF